jgi:ferredoxin/coenzyme F420-reducing hydrogenase delta subunit
MRGDVEPRRGFRALTKLDGLANRIYTSPHNPLYHSGAITAGLLLVLLVTGVYLLLFYRLGAPYESVVRLHEQVWTGRWIRGLHRFASGAAVVAAAVHAFRMYAQRRTWGPRALAWVSGLVLVGVIFVSAWTGYVLVWDAHGQLLAVEGARLMDAVPVLSEPMSRSFTGEAELPSGFFFVNLFAHIALPLSLAVLLWVHVARVSRPVLLPSRPVLWGSILALTVAAVVWPAPLPAKADLLRLPADVPVDWFFAFWLPLSQRLPAGVVWLLGAVVLAVLLAVPWLTRPKRLPAPAVVTERTCTGCEQCVKDCPYDAIEMVIRDVLATDTRGGERSTLVARVRTELCTSCGICIGSCPPMAISALDVSGRDQLAEVSAFLARERPGASDVVMIGCTWSSAAVVAERSGAKLLSVPCVGTVHSSMIETLLRGGAGGVLVAGCMEHDGRTREGVTWTRERLYEGRAAELKPRVDRDRIRLVQATLSDGVRLHAAVDAFRTEIEALAEATPEEQIDIVALCEARQGGETVEAS